MVKIWLMAARVRTLPAAVAPVLVGTALAHALEGTFRAGAFIAALLGALAFAGLARPPQLPARILELSR